ncbi:hypothetical protein N7468_001731 [Penicillium chermesinum]|uniref:Major facilitator superfamily (MFS) profile domain-containing protein n=1 Tax=Penicillium chermesinum TaxID=63820 RepID=A0A9W9PJB6_9EURO|nr:uncharacterized protein N7468_001731 [Penicillium chermesinum]KAJ5246748.1 hypothetical protein N7468_001731 [Penicillium chermesinum]KAJ6145014.1 hypothetical protein N7470_008909 [Penicillium chermesinum]
MGHPLISPDIFVNEPKSKYVSNGSIQSIDESEVLPDGQGFESTIQLFGYEPQPEEQPWRPHVRDWAVFICIVILAMMDAFDSTVLIPVVPHLASEFDKPLVSMLWVNTAYLLFSTAGQLFFAMMADVFAHAPLWISAAVCTTVGTGICSGSMGVTELIVGRVLQGIGGGGCLSMCFVVMAESTPPAIHSRYSCYILLTRLIGFVLGPIAGGLFVDNANWTWGFYFNFIFCALGLLAIPFASDLRVPNNLPLRKLRTLDWSGAVMAIVAPGCMVIGLSWGGILFHWAEWQVVVPLAVGAGVLIALVLYESIWTLRPQFGARVFRNWPTAATYIGCFCHGFVLFGHLQFFALYFMFAKYFSATLSGVALVAILGFAIMPAAVVGIILARESECSKFVISGGWILTTVTAGCAIVLDPSTPTVGWVFLFFTAGLGHGLLLSSYNIRTHSLRMEESGTFSTQPITISIFTRAYGMAISVPVGGVIFLNLFGQALFDAGLSRDLSHGARGYLISMNEMQMPAATRDAVKYAATGGLQAVWELIAVVSALGGVSSVALWRK